MNEHEKMDYASLLIKTATLSKHEETNYSLSIVSHNDPLIKKRVEDILNNSTSAKNDHFLLIHILVMIAIVSISFIFTWEPYGFNEYQVNGSYDLEADLGSTSDNTYIIDTGSQYELYIDGEFVGDMTRIPDEFKDYPVYKKPADKSIADGESDSSAGPTNKDSD